MQCGTRCGARGRGMGWVCSSAAGGVRETGGLVAEGRMKAAATSAMDSDGVHALEAADACGLGRDAGEMHHAHNGRPRLCSALRFTTASYRLAWMHAEDSTCWRELLEELVVLEKLPPPPPPSPVMTAPCRSPSTKPSATSRVASSTPHSVPSGRHHAHSITRLVSGHSSSPTSSPYTTTAIIAHSASHPSFSGHLAGRCQALHVVLVLRPPARPGSS